MKNRKELLLTFDFNQRPTILIGRKWLQKVINIFAEESNLKSQSYFSLAFINETEMKKLNHNYRQQNQVTDVLSFADEKNGFVEGEQDSISLGEVVICVPQAKKQARQLGHSVRKEISRLLIHGLAHLVGHDHENVSRLKADQMVTLEDKVMDKLFF